MGDPFIALPRNCSGFSEASGTCKSLLLLLYLVSSVEMNGTSRPLGNQVT
jgi:hypothetical protein